MKLSPSQKEVLRYAVKVHPQKNKNKPLLKPYWAGSSRTIQILLKLKLIEFDHGWGAAMYRLTDAGMEEANR